MANDHNDASWLKSTVEQYATQYGYQAASSERGLEGFAAHLFAQEDGYNEILDGLPTTEVDLSERICRTHDLGIDGVLEDHLNKRIMLIQCAWRRKPLEEDKVATFFDAPDRLVSPEYRATGGEQIQELLADFAEQLRDGWEVSLRFVTSASVGADSRLSKLVESKNQKYEERDQAISCELYGLAELRRHDGDLTAATTAGLNNKVKIHFQSEKFIQISHPYPSVIGVIKGTELAGLYRERGAGPALFNLNIRLPLTSKKVNPGIVETAVSPTEAPHFLYYNNGVSAVCAKFEWLDKNTIEATRFQIINGAQTVSALAKAYAKKAGDAYVLFRLTQADSYGGSFTDNIIRFNNTQNPVKVSDFFSNDDIQIWLRDHLPSLSGKGPLPPFYYVHKSGYKPNGATGRGVSIEQAAAIRHAFIYGPVPGYKEPKQFFDKENGIYWEAFGSGGVEAKFWSSEEVAEFAAALAVNERILTVAKAVRADPATRDSLDAKYLYRLSRYALGLVGVGLRAIQDSTFNDFTTLIASNTTFSKYVDPLVQAVRQEMRHEWRTRTAPGKEVRPEYNFARDLTTWNRLAEGIRDTSVTDVLPAVR